MWPLRRFILQQRWYNYWLCFAEREMTRFPLLCHWGLGSRQAWLQEGKAALTSSGEELGSCYTHPPQHPPGQFSCWGHGALHPKKNQGPHSALTAFQRTKSNAEPLPWARLGFPRPP